MKRATICQTPSGRSLSDENASQTGNRRLAARPRYAKFPFCETVHDFDFGLHRRRPGTSIVVAVPSVVWLCRRLISPLLRGTM